MSEQNMVPVLISKTQTARIRNIAISTYITQLECSVDHSRVIVHEPVAGCYRGGHRWVRTPDGWKQFRSEW